MKEEYSSDHSRPALPTGGLRLQRLTADQVQQIDDIIASLGEFGEVHLVIQHGRLKYINKMESHKAWKDEDGRDP